MENSIKLLRFNLESPIVSDSKVESSFDVPKMLTGSHIPDSSYVEKASMADAVRLMCKYHTSFKISEDQKMVCENYFIDGMEMKEIEQKTGLSFENVKKLIQRLKIKAYKLWTGQVKKSDLDRLSKNFTFVSETSVS